MNFKEETLDVLAANGKTWDDVKFIQGEDFVVANSKNEILELMNFEYDDGYGSQKIASDLVIVGDGWWLERSEYDGAEGWDYKETPKRLTNSKFITRFQVNDSQVVWKSLKKCNQLES